jgi:hypothetical protein
MFEHPYEPSTGIPYILALVEVLRALVWPSVAAVVAYLYREDLRAVLPRIVRFGATGVELQPLQGMEAEPKPASKPTLAASNPIKDPVMFRLDEANRTALQAKPEEEREEVLLAALVAAQMKGFFATIYANIFGSQIRFLRALNVRSLTRQEAEHWFADVQRQHDVFANWDLNGYFAFLRSWELVEEQGGLIGITETGRSFLRFLTDYQMSDERSF